VAQLFSSRARRVFAKLNLFQFNHLMPAGADAFGPADEEINQRADPVGEDDHQNPDDFFVALARLLGGGLDQHPNPKGKQHHHHRQAHQHEDEGQREKRRQEKRQVKKCSVQEEILPDNPGG